MRAYRIAQRRFGRDKRQVFSGISGFRVDGRWHSRGRFLDYAAESRALAAMERLVHFKRNTRLVSHVICVLDIPDRMIGEIGRAPKGWDGDEPSPKAQALGNEWCDRMTSPALRVPSAVVEGEWNLLVNSLHPDWRWAWVVSGPDEFHFDPRLTRRPQAARAGTPG